MKMKKVIFAILCLIIGCVIVTACGSKDKKIGKNNGDKNTVKNEKTTESILDTDNKTQSQSKAKSLNINYHNIYDNILLDSDVVEYGLCDINGDGYKELIVRKGTCEADFIYEIYTCSDGQASLVGSIGAGHSCLYHSNSGSNCIYIESAQMGYQVLYKITLNNGQIVEKKIAENQTNDDYAPLNNDYSYDNMVNMVSPSDKSLLD